MAKNETREELVKIGGELMISGGFGQTGIDAVLKRAKVPKGSFYYYFESKEAFGLAIIDQFADEMLGRMEKHLRDTSAPPLERLRNYLAGGLVAIGGEGCKKGCLFGDLGQEMAHQNEKFRCRLDEVFGRWKKLVAACLLEARKSKALFAKADPDELAEFILSGWEGAVMRAKVARSVAPLKQFMDVLFSRVLTP